MSVRGQRAGQQALPESLFICRTFGPPAAVRGWVAALAGRALICIDSVWVFTFLRSLSSLSRRFDGYLLLGSLSCRLSWGLGAFHFALTQILGLLNSNLGLQYFQIKAKSEHPPVGQQAKPTELPPPPRPVFLTEGALPAVRSWLFNSGKILFLMV